MHDLTGRQNPLALLYRALKLWFGGQVRFVRDLKGQEVEDRGEVFVAFRKAVVEPAPGQPAKPGATFRVRFRFKNLSGKANRILSLIPIPLIVAQPGFRSKTWLLGQRTGDFFGLYEFDSAKTAGRYWDSLPLQMMRRRAAPGSLFHEITRLEQ